MGLSSALASAMSGLRANQAALSIVSSNVANSQTPGYVVQRPNQIEVTTGDFGSTAMTTGVSRELDTFVQNQLRTETGGSGYADQMANILKQLQSVYGTPGNSGTLETALNKFTTALQALSTSAGSSSAQTVALGAAQALAQQLNVTTNGIQSLRSNVEQDLGTSAQQANAAMQQIADINTKLQGLSANDPSAATLMDQRDQAINTLSKYVDVRVTTDGSNQANIYTTTGIQLVGAGLASQFTFASAGALSATSLYNTDPAKSGVGALNIKLPNGSQLDVVANNVVSSGQIAADLKLRDQTLVQAQNQIDQLAATMSSALSDKTTAGSTVSGPPAGFRSRPCRCAAGQYGQHHLQRHGDQHPAPDHARQRDRPGGAAAPERHQCQPDAGGRQFLRRHECDRRCAQHRALRLAPDVLRRSVAGDGHDAAGDR